MGRGWGAHGSHLRLAPAPLTADAGLKRTALPSTRQVVKLLYDADLVLEEAIHDWAHEKENATKDERRFVELSAELLQWLAQDSETESESGSESE